MANDPLAKEVSDEPADTGAAVQLYGYREPPVVELDQATEANLSFQIKLGNVARDALRRNILLVIQPRICVQNCNPLSVQQIETTVERVISYQLVASATKHLAVDALAEQLIDNILIALTDLLRSVDLNSDLNVEQWLHNLVDSEDLTAGVVGALFNSADLRKNLEQRETAINFLVMAHLRLAKPFVMRIMSQSFERDDLMNEAFLILRRAAECFDPAHGNRFSAYAKKSLQNELKRQSPTRIGLRRQTNMDLKQFDIAQQTLAQQQGCKPNLDDIYDLLACKEKTRNAIENARRVMILHRGIQHADEQYLFDPLDELALDPSIDASDREELSKLHAALSLLEPFEKEVVIGYCKLGISFRAMAKQQHRSPHTLQQIYRAALLKLAEQIDAKSTHPKPR